MSTVFKSFADLKSADISTVAEPAAPRQISKKKAAKKAVAPAAIRQPIAPPKAKKPVAFADTTRQRQQRPVFEPETPMPETVEDLENLLAAVFYSRGMPTSVPLAGYAMEVFVASVARRATGEVPSHERLVTQAFEGLVHEVSANTGSNLSGTRCRRLVRMMDEVPGVAEGQMVRISTKKGEDLVRVDRPKDASSALEVFKKFAVAIDEQALADLEVAKTTRRDSLRIDRLKRVRDTTPDLGSAIILAALKSGGFSERGYPKFALDRCHFQVIAWTISILKDLREIVGTDDEVTRGEALCELLPDELGMNTIAFAELRDAVARIVPRDGDPQSKRAAAKAAYVADREAGDAILTTWKRVQEALDDVQAGVTSVVDATLAWARHAYRLKEWARSNEAARKGEAPRPISNEPRVLQPRKAGKPSSATPDEAVANMKKQALADAPQGTNEVGFEVEYGESRFNAEALNLTAVFTRKVLHAARLDGGRVCEVYPGVIWEAVIGPVDHALDMDRDTPESRIVVIAPRRVGGMGLDLSEARALLVADYESFFEPVPADE